MNPRTAIVTGGSRGIGRAIVEKFAAEGCDVAFGYRANAEAARNVAEGAAASGRRVAAFQVDVTDFDQSAAFVAKAREFLGDVDALVNNAGITRDKSLFLMAGEEWHDVINTNLNGCFNITRNLIGYFMKNKKGCIVNVSSVAGFAGIGGQTNYCASKAAIIGFTRSLGKEAAKTGVRVNCVAPGYIETDMTGAINPDHVAALKKMVPLQRFGTAAEVAELVWFLASEKASYITGQVFTIDGGLTA